MRNFDRTCLSDPLLIAGGTLIALGVAFIYWPAGIIVAGLACIAVGWALGAK